MMVRKVPGWVEVVVQVCLEAKGKFGDGEGEDGGETLKAWLSDDVSDFFCCIAYVLSV